MQFGIFIYDGVEPIDLATFGVLSMARRIAPEIAICTIAPRAGPVALANGLKVTADFGIDDAPGRDLVIVTGGPGWTAQAKVPATLDYISVSMHRAVIARLARAVRSWPRAACRTDGPATTSAKWWRRKPRRSR